VPKQVVVLIRNDQQDTLEDDLAQAGSLERRGAHGLALLNARLQVYHIPDDRSIGQVMAALSADPRIISVQPNYLYRHQKADDAGTPAVMQYSSSKLALPEAHRLAQGRGVVVAVIDSAVDSSHPDLHGAVSASFDAIGGPEDKDDTHGTAIAGVIRGRGTAGGVAPEAKLLAVRAFAAKPGGGDPEATTESVALAIQWSLDNGANVLNMSFTGAKDRCIEQMLAKALAMNAVAVAAAGNGGPDAEPAYPAAYPGVIAVTAVDDRDQIYVNANQGPYIAVAAPGVSILAPAAGGGYEFFTGTSFAAAEVSGIAALMLERDRELKPEAALEVMRSTAERLQAAAGEDAGGAGLVNAYASLRALDAR
jgi:subtilisin family serine protease